MAHKKVVCAIVVVEPVSAIKVVIEVVLSGAIEVVIAVIVVISITIKLLLCV